MKRSWIKKGTGKNKAAHRKVKLKSVSWWKKAAWKVFSRWIRNRDNWTCFTCGTRVLGMGMHAGHFVPRIHNATFLSEINVNAQCYVCNIRKKGNAGEYAFRLIEKYGKDQFDELVKLGRTYKSFTVPELQDIIKKYSIE